MENLDMEMTLFFAREVVLSLRNEKINYVFIFEIGKERYVELIKFLIENNEISDDEKNELVRRLEVFNFTKEEVRVIESMKIEIQEGKSHWESVNINLLEKMINFELTKEEDVIRYLAHRNHYQQVIAWSESKRELFEIAKKYGSERTQIQFKNYETMKLLENKLSLKNFSKEKFNKI